MTFRNPFSEEGKWYRANLHTHTTESDGALTPAERVEAYKTKGYSILAITDHGAVTNVDEFSTKDFLAIPAMEGHGNDGDNFYHIVALNVPYDLHFSDSEPIQKFILKANDAGGMAFIAHPYWLGLRADEIMKLEGIVGIEVFNAVCGDKGKSVSSVHWDDVLQKGRRIIGLAVDDAHRDGHDVFVGWTWLKLKELSVEAAMEALRSGCFYSSTGPEIEDIKLDGGTVQVQCSPVKSISILAQTWHGKRYLAGEGKTITCVEHKLNGEEKYLRIECTDAAGKTAWSNPFYLK